MKKLIFIFTALIVLSSCSERYNLETNTYEESLVVEATITNELKTQEVKLTKTYRLESYGPTVETGANVYVSDNLGNQYTFVENSGIYKSVNPFQALPGRSYQLHFTTSNGKTYESTPEQTPTATQIQDITKEVITKDGVRGVQMSAQSFDPTNTSKYYRYEYEETHKIIAPKYVNRKIVYLGYQNLILVQRTDDVSTCFKTNFSSDLIFTNTNSLSEDRVNHPIRFIDYKNYIIANRYSILVKQYVQNLKSYNYFQTLKLISGNGNSVLSQNQPGFLRGNLTNSNDPKDKVIGFFDVSTVSFKRIFFNFDNLFPTDLPPKYPTDCSPEMSGEPQRFFRYEFCTPASPPTCALYQGDNVTGFLQNGSYLFYSGYGLLNTTIPINTGVSLEIYPSPCGDCTSFNNNSNIRPTFWID